jgi:hypothetical protein
LFSTYFSAMLNYKWIGAVLGAGALLFRFIAAQFPERTEEIYSRTVFPVIRQLIDMSLSRLPFPSVYLFVAAALGVIVFFFFQIRKKKGLKSKSKYFIRSALNFSGFLVFFFLLLWGYNYQRLPVYRQLSLEPVLLSPEELVEEIELTHGALLPLRMELTPDALSIEETIPYHRLEEKVRKEMKEILPQLGFDGRGYPRTKEFYPAGFMRRMGISGIYFPFTGESYIDPTLHNLEKPFTIAHEMAHSFGITHEGEANFISWVIGMQSKDALLQYSAQLQLFRYQLNELYRRDLAAYKEMTDRMDEGVKNDITSIMLKAREIRPLSPELSRRSNDLFLKTQGVKAGVQSYAQLPALAHAWRKNRMLK